uniref:Transposase, MuDR, MULE transposase domain protein n=1 Tax=Tanacetum cinerariifolium TaxID=118510 RepID=A0A699H7F3_TANCI|nr:transposase, MuDR, MULE transposase domain protein [Tanacetum cinerariifolium]
MPSTSAVIENKYDKLLLLAWYDSSTLAIDFVCNSVTPMSMPQHIIVHALRILFVTPLHLRVCLALIEDVKRQLSFEKTKLDGEPGSGDVAGSGIDYKQLWFKHICSCRARVDVGRTEKQIVQHIRVDEVVNGSAEEVVVHDACTNDDDYDDEDDDFFVDEENDIVEPDVDMHLFGISKDDPFDNIGVTNLVLKDVLEGEDVDVVNLDGYDSDTCYDSEQVLTGREELKLKLKGRLKVITFCSMLCFETMLLNYSLQTLIPMSRLRLRNIDPSLPTRVFKRIYVWLEALKLRFTVCKRQLLGLDGAFRKGPFSCHVLAVVGLDSNNGIYPLAYVLVEAKSKSSW